VALLNGPWDLTIDPSGNILIADTGNNCIRQLTGGSTADAVTSAPLTVVSSASLLQGPIAPSEIVTIFGNGFDPAHSAVTFDNIPAIIFYAGPGQVNVLVPASVKANGTTAISVLANGLLAGTATINTVAASPGIFAVTNGMGQAAALNQDGSVNAASNAAAIGSVVVLYLTGDGGSGAPVEVLVGNYTADVLYAGPAPGFQGLMQINARIPSGATPGAGVPVSVTIGGVSSQPGVTIAVQ